MKSEQGVGTCKIKAPTPLFGHGEERARLDAAYRATTYRVHDKSLPAGSLDIRVDTRHEILDAFLQQQDIAEWAYLSAENPKSEILLPTQNAARSAALNRYLVQMGYRCFKGVAVADQGDWPEEQGVLVLNLSQSAAVTLARDWGQNAFLYARCGAPVALIWCADVLQD